MLYGYFPSLLAGAWVTLQVALLSLLLALALGLAGASSRLSSHAVLRLPATADGADRSAKKKSKKQAARRGRPREGSS